MLIAMSESKDHSLEPSTSPDGMFKEKTEQNIQASLRMTNRSKDTNENKLLYGAKFVFCLR